MARASAALGLASAAASAAPAVPAPRVSARVSRLLLRNVPLFATLSDSQVEVLTQVIQRRSFRRGASIIRSGESASSLHVIVSGMVQVVVSDRHGAEVILDILKPGDYFGEMGLIDDLPPSATVTARESCEILILAKNDFTTCLRENGNLAVALQRGLVKRLRGANSKIGSLALLDVHGRVARALLDMSTTVDGQQVVNKLSKQDLAKLIGASREMVSRVLGNLQAQGHIEMSRSAIILKKTSPG